ncbi:MAG: hypothetical protein O7D91_14735 [Planctomycetota bacterium]|nr:hypothetical protein [Planctomycetota bacterium]
MNLPRLNYPELYQGLYVFDFGEHVAVGYTAEEIEVLLGSPEFKGGRAYKIHHATAAGELSLRGLSRMDVNVREGMVFYRASADASRGDFEALKQSATTSAPPAVLHWRLGCDSQAEMPECTVLSYAAEASDRVGRWLEAIGFAGGDQVEAGTHLADYFARPETVEHEHLAIAPDPRYHSRPPAEVLASVHKPVQRELTYP